MFALLFVRGMNEDRIRRYCNRAVCSAGCWAATVVMEIVSHMGVPFWATPHTYSLHVASLLWMTNGVSHYVREALTSVAPRTI